MNKLVERLNWLAYAALPLYLWRMVYFPWASNDWKWEEVQKVWHDWQTLNVGVLAFMTSIVAFNITKYNEEKQRQRNFVASRAFLPEALSHLVNYYEDCSNVLKEAWVASKDRIRPYDLKSPVPELPDGYKMVFKDCISSAPPVVAEHLAKILRNLQVNNSRLNSLRKEFRGEGGYFVSEMNVLSYIYALAELYVLTSDLFKYSRGEVEHFHPNWTLEQFDTAYRILGIDVEDYDDLWGYTSRVYKKR